MRQSRIYLFLFVAMLIFIFFGQASAYQEDNYVVANDPTIEKALALLPEQPLGISVFLFYANCAPATTQELLKGRAGFQLPGESWIGIVAESRLYISAKNSTGKSGELYALASAIYHEYWHLRCGHRGVGENMSATETKKANQDEVDALSQQKKLLTYFLKHHKNLRTSTYFHNYCIAIDIAVLSYSQ